MTLLALLVVLQLMNSVKEGSSLSHQCSPLQNLKCYRNVSVVHSRSMQRYVTKYQVRSYATYHCCNWFCWSKCSRTSYRRTSRWQSYGYTEYYRVYTNDQYCCDGYRLAKDGKSCEPVCNCTIAESCIAPNTCRQGMELRLNGLKLSNNTVLDLSSITSSCETLACTTDLPSSTQTLRWYYPNQTEVGNDTNSDFYVSHGGYGELYLHRTDQRTNTTFMVPSGKYCCDYHTSLCVEIDDASRNRPRLVADPGYLPSLPGTSEALTTTENFTIPDAGSKLTDARNIYIPIVLAVIIFVIFLTSVVLGIFLWRRCLNNLKSSTTLQYNDRAPLQPMEHPLYYEIPVSVSIHETPSEMELNAWHLYEEMSADCAIESSGDYEAVDPENCHYEDEDDYYI